MLALPSWLLVLQKIARRCTKKSAITQFLFFGLRCGRFVVDNEIVFHGVCDRDSFVQTRAQDPLPQRNVSRSGRSRCIRDGRTGHRRRRDCCFLQIDVHRCLFQTKVRRNAVATQFADLYQVLSQGFGGEWSQVFHHGPEHAGIAGAIEEISPKEELGSRHADGSDVDGCRCGRYAEDNLRCAIESTHAKRRGNGGVR